MEGQYFPPPIVAKFSLEEIVFNVMRHARRCHGVMDFPLFTDLRWHLFIYYAQDQLKKLAFPPLDVEFSWEGIRPVVEDRGDILCGLDAVLFAATLPVEGQPDRMQLTESAAGERGFGEEFYKLAEALYQASQLIEGFAPPTY